MPFRTKTGLSPGPGPYPRKLAEPPIRPMSIVCKRSPISATAEHLYFVWPLYGTGQAITVLPCGFFLSFFFFLFSSSNLSGPRIKCLPYFYTWRGPSANLECRSQMCCTQLAGNAGPKKSPKIRHLGTIAQLCRATSSQLRHVGLSTIGKKLLNSNVSPTCPYIIVNFSLLAVEIVSLVWGTPANFNGVRVLAVLLHGTLGLGISETLWR